MTQQDQQAVTIIVRKLETAQGKAKAVTNGDLRKYLANYNLFLPDRTIREIVMRLRISGRIKMLCATTTGKKSGYYIATDRQEAWEYIKRLKSRMDSVSKTHAALVKQFHQAFNLSIPFEEPLSQDVILSCGFRATSVVGFFVMDRQELGGYTIIIKKSKNPIDSQHGVFKGDTLLKIINTRGKLLEAVAFLTNQPQPQR